LNKAWSTKKIEYYRYNIDGNNGAIGSQSK